MRCPRCEGDLIEIKTPSSSCLSFGLCSLLALDATVDDYKQQVGPGPQCWLDGDIETDLDYKGCRAHVLSLRY